MRLARRADHSVLSALERRLDVVLPELQHPVGYEPAAGQVGAFEIDELELVALQALLDLRVVEQRGQRLWPRCVEDADALVTGPQPSLQERDEDVVAFLTAVEGADVVSDADFETRGAEVDGCLHASPPFSGMDQDPTPEPWVIGRAGQNPTRSFHSPSALVRYEEDRSDALAVLQCQRPSCLAAGVRSRIPAVGRALGAGRDDRRRLARHRGADARKRQALAVADQVKLEAWLAPVDRDRRSAEAGREQPPPRRDEALVVQVGVDLGEFGGQPLSVNKTCLVASLCVMAMCVGHGLRSRMRRAASRRAAALRSRAARSSLVMAGSYCCWTPPAPSTPTNDKVTS